MGQSLIEVIAGTAIAVIIISSVARLVSVSTRVSNQNKESQTAAFLIGEILENITTYADSKWYCPGGTCPSDGLNRGIYNLNRNTNYFLQKADTTPFIWVVGSEAINLADQTTVYNRYFYVENVCRNNIDGSVTEVEGIGCLVGTTEDPSTQLVTAVVAWTKNGENFGVQTKKYITRTRNAVVSQTDWSVGSWDNCVGTNLFTDNQFKYACDDGNINSSGKPGSIKINGY